MVDSDVKSIYRRSGLFTEDIINSARAGWAYWRQVGIMLCDHLLPFWLKGHLIKTIDGPALLYGAECWAIEKC